MFDFSSFIRDFQERPLIYPILRSYSWFLSIKRYEKFPFYIYPQGMSISSYEDKFVRFLDFLVDAHELERNKNDNEKNFYQRTKYVLTNFPRNTNETFANLTFDTRIRKTEYDRLNSIMYNA